MSVRTTLEKLGAKPWVVNTARLGGGTALAQMLVVAATPVITRLYGPGELGLLGLFASFVSFASVAVCLRYEMAIVSAEDDQEADTLLALSLGLALLLSLAGAAALAVLMRFDVLSYGALPLWSTGGVVLALAGAGAFTGLRFWYVRRAGFGTIVRALVAQAAGRAGLPVALGLFHLGWLGLMLGEIAGRGLGVGEMMRGAWPAIKKTLGPFWRARCARALKRNWKYPALLLPSSLVDALAVWLPLPIVSSLFGTAAAGQFLLVMRVAAWPASLISASVSDVFHEGVTGAARSQPERVRSVLWLSARNLGGVGLLVYLPAGILSPALFPIVFGPQWRQAGLLMALLSPFLLVALVVSPLSRLLLVVNRQEWKLLVDAVCLAVPLVAFFGGQRAGLGFLSCVALFSGLNVIAYLFYFAVIARAARSFGMANATVGLPAPDPGRQAP